MLYGWARWILEAGPSLKAELSWAGSNGVAPDLVADLLQSGRDLGDARELHDQWQKVFTYFNSTELNGTVIVRIEYPTAQIDSATTI